MEWLLLVQERKEGSGLLRPLESLLLTLANQGMPAIGGSISPRAQGLEVGAGFARLVEGQKQAWEQRAELHFQALLSLSWSNPSSRRLSPRWHCWRRGRSVWWPRDPRIGSHTQFPPPASGHRGGDSADPCGPVGPEVAVWRLQI